MTLKFTEKEKNKLKEEFEKQDELYHKYKDEGVTIDEARDIVEGNASLEEVLNNKNKLELLFLKMSSSIDSLKLSNSKEEGKCFALELKKYVDKFIETNNDKETYDLFWSKITELGVSNMLTYKELKLSLMKFREKQDNLRKNASKEQMLEKVKLTTYDYIPIRYEGAFSAQKYKEYIRNNEGFVIYCYEIAKALKVFHDEKKLENLVYVLYGINDFVSRFPRIFPYFKEFYERKYEVEEVVSIILKSYEKYVLLEELKDFKVLNVEYVLSNSYFLYKRILKVNVLINNDLNVEIIYNKETNILISYKDSIYKVCFDLFERQREDNSFTKKLLSKVEKYLNKNLKVMYKQIKEDSL